MDAVIVTPEGVDATCLKPPARMLDYMVVSRHALPFISSVVPYHCVPLGPHIGVHITFKNEFRNLLARSLQLLAAFVQPPVAKKMLDLASRTSKRKRVQELSKLVKLRKHSAAPKMLWPLR